MIWLLILVVLAVGYGLFVWLGHQDIPLDDRSQSERRFFAGPVAMSAPERRAIERLQQGGWWRGFGSGSSGGGKYCYLTALGWESVDELEEARDRAEKIIREQFPERCVEGAGSVFTVTDFNDHPDTTLDDVLLVLEKAAIEAESQL